jgi:hypothetical protein
VSPPFFFLSRFKALEDLRQRGKVVYSLDEILLLWPARGDGRSGGLRRYYAVCLVVPFRGGWR